MTAHTVMPAVANPWRPAVASGMSLAFVILMLFLSAAEWISPCSGTLHMTLVPWHVAHGVTVRGHHVTPLAQNANGGVMSTQLLAPSVHIPWLPSTDAVVARHLQLYAERYLDAPNDLPWVMVSHHTTHISRPDDEPTTFVSTALLEYYDDATDKTTRICCATVVNLGPGPVRMIATFAYCARTICYNALNPKVLYRDDVTYKTVCGAPSMVYESIKHSEFRTCLH